MDSRARRSPPRSGVHRPPCTGAVLALRRRDDAGTRSVGVGRGCDGRSEPIALPRRHDRLRGVHHPALARRCGSRPRGWQVLAVRWVRKGAGRVEGGEACRRRASRRRLPEVRRRRAEQRRRQLPELHARPRRDDRRHALRELEQGREAADPGFSAPTEARGVVRSDRRQRPEERRAVHADQHEQRTRRLRHDRRDAGRAPRHRRGVAHRRRRVGASHRGWHEGGPGDGAVHGRFVVAVRGPDPRVRAEPWAPARRGVVRARGVARTGGPGRRRGAPHAREGRAREEEGGREGHFEKAEEGEAEG